MDVSRYVMDLADFQCSGLRVIVDMKSDHVMVSLHTKDDQGFYKLVAQQHFPIEHPEYAKLKSKLDNEAKRHADTLERLRITENTRDCLAGHLKVSKEDLASLPKPPRKNKDAVFHAFKERQPGTVYYNTDPSPRGIIVLGNDICLVINDGKKAKSLFVGPWFHEVPVGAQYWVQANNSEARITEWFEWPGEAAKECQ